MWHIDLNGGSMSVSIAGLETRSLTPDELMQLVEKAKEKESEAAFILVLDEYEKEGSLFRSVKKPKVIHGKAEKIRLEKYSDSFGYEATYLYIPKTVPVIIEEREYYSNRYEEYETIRYWIFTSEGWKCVVG